MTLTLACTRQYWSSYWSCMHCCLCLHALLLLLDKTSPESYTKLLSDWRQIWVIANDDRHLTAQLSCLEPDQQIIEAMVQFAD